MMKRLISSMMLLLVATARMGAQEDARNSRADEASIRAAMSGLVDAWNRHDMEAFAAGFAEDADFVNAIGLYWRGRAEILKEHQALHATRMKDSHLTVAETTVRFLRPEVATVHIRWELTGDTGLEGKPLPTRRGMMTQVLVKTRDKWLIAVSQNTDIAPLPNVPAAK